MEYPLRIEEAVGSRVQKGLMYGESSDTGHPTANDSCKTDTSSQMLIRKQIDPLHGVSNRHIYPSVRSLGYNIRYI